MHGYATLRYYHSNWDDVFCDPQMVWLRWFPAVDHANTQNTPSRSGGIGRCFGGHIHPNLSRNSRLAAFFLDIQMHIHHELGEALLIFLTRKFVEIVVTVVSKSFQFSGVQCQWRPILDETKDKRTEKKTE